MKKWSAAELVELNIAETANGNIDFFVEASHNGFGTNNDLLDGNDSNHNGYPNNGDDSSSTPENSCS